jgi:cytidylate kinase
MSVVTIRGQLGSGAPEIGKLAAKQLKFDYVDREIMSNVADKINWPVDQVSGKEMPPGTLFGRIIEALGKGYAVSASASSASVFSSAYMHDWELPLSDDTYKKGLESVVLELARGQSIVIRGRGSQFILKDTPNSFHFLVVAPFDLRKKRIMDSNDLSEDNAKKEIEQFDNSRREFAKRYFNANLEDPVNYDLVINTRILSYEEASAIITRIVKHKAISTQK